jgi:hypothetical protein
MFTKVQLNTKNSAVFSLNGFGFFINITAFSPHENKFIFSLHLNPWKQMKKQKFVP